LDRRGKWDYGKTIRFFYLILMFVLNFRTLLTILKNDKHKTKLNVEQYIKMYQFGKVYIGEVLYMVYGMGRV